MEAPSEYRNTGAWFWKGDDLAEVMRSIDMYTRMNGCVKRVCAFGIFGCIDGGGWIHFLTIINTHIDLLAT